MTPDDPCPRCLRLSDDGVLDYPEMVQPLGERPALARDKSGVCCSDCRAADALMRYAGIDFDMARIAVGNDRMEQNRLPGAPIGLVGAGFMKPSEPGALDRHLAWLRKHAKLFRDWGGDDLH